MSSLFEINKRGDLVMCNKLQEFDKAKERVKDLQSKKAMADNWKLDIFISDNSFALQVMRISPSAAFKKGVSEWRIAVLNFNSSERRDTNDIYDLMLAGFPTKESALSYVDDVSAYIEYRYGMVLKLSDIARQVSY